MPKGFYERKSEEQRFWEKVDVKEENQCWLWLGSKDTDGYGWFSLSQNMTVNQEGKSISAHRYSLMLKLQNKNLDSSVFARHSCDTRSCVNPHHLIEGSAKDNSNDMVERNRQAKGQQNSQAKMTEDVAKKILEEYSADKQSGRLYGSLERLAKKYDQKKQSIYKLTSGKTWKHLHMTEET